MASVLLFLLATLAVATASTADGQQKQYYSGSCNPSELAEILDNCKDAKPLLDARNECCQKLGQRGKCLCPGIKELIKMGVPLQGLCDSYSACSGTWSSSGGAAAGLIEDDSCTPPDEGTVDTCKRLVKQAKCLCYRRAEQDDKSGCFAEALAILGIKNAGVVDELCRG